MTTDDIISLAEQAGCALAHSGQHLVLVGETAIGRLVETVQKAERERCAKLCDEIASDMWSLYKGRPPYKGDEDGRASDFTQGRSAGAADCADAIRSR